MTQKQASLPQIPTDEEAELIQSRIDEIFELAKSNMWDFEQFAKKILAGCVACDSGYVVIAIDLINTVTGLKGESNHALLFFFVDQANKLDMGSINKAHLLFQHGLLIKSIQAEQGTL
ncbi:MULTISPECIES: hypothetical protein [unclassified Microcoleus]|uniref:hypothetical protein n=1 Tax=unclassified Microcoleus TaxID=2642155 RepID=UPI002FD2375C